MSRKWIGVALFGAASLGVVAACSSDDSSGTPSNGDAGTSSSSSSGGNTTGGDGSVAVVGCPANTKSCVNDKLARVCPADGSGWIAQTCAADEKCNAGACEKDPSVVPSCTSAMNACVGNTALVCKSDGKGFTATACPANTVCVENGRCQGAYIVGSSTCKADLAGYQTIIQTSADGFQLTDTSCPAGQYCVDQGNGTAACKAGTCNPKTDKPTCGNKISTTADQTKFYSTCAPAPGGYTWIATQCTGVTTCNPTSVTCTSDCTPGTSRCASNDLGIQTCDATGNWSATVTSCNANPASTDLVCMTDPKNPASRICGERPCADGDDGVCQADGKIKLCGTDGKVAATATACSSGSCQNGRCKTECTTGEERCVLDGGVTYQTCVNGLWSAPQNCATGVCYGYTSSSTNLRAKLCNAVCKPGTHRCTATDGDAGAGNDYTAIETCSATGQWSAASACTVGKCDPVYDYSKPYPWPQVEASCTAQCVPNTKVCDYDGDNYEYPCTATGLFPTSGTSCASGKTCRTTASGVSLGCVDCIGPNHGQTPESRCVDGSNAPVTTGGDGTEICQANDTWPAQGTVCPGSTKCTTQVTNYYCFLVDPQFNNTCGSELHCASGEGDYFCPGYPGTIPASCK